MPETQFNINTDDGHVIHGVLNQAKEKKNKKAVIHAHGLTGWAYEVAQTQMALSFPDHGYDIIRPYLYTWLDGGRRLIDCTIKTHAQDINTVVQHFSKNYDSFFITGHSYGGPTAMLSDQSQFKAMSLWDPTYIPAKSFENSDDKGDVVLFYEGSGVCLGKDMYDESRKYDQNWAQELSKNVVVPIQVIHASEGMWVKEKESFHSNASVETDYHIIDKTVHCFVEEGTTEQLLEHSLNWFNKF